MATALEKRLQTILDKRQQSSKLRTLKRTPSASIDFSSNDFLSLSTNAAFRQDFLDRLNSYDLGVGSTGSRLLDGNSGLAEQLEQDITAFHGAESALLTNSGFDANVSIFTCLPQPGDVVIYDELIHASVHDGMRAGRAKQCIAFRHNDVQHLAEVVEAVLPISSTNNIFVAVESVYSMEGDLAPLTEICDLLDAAVPKGRAHLIVDEAHSTGCYGDNGAGRVSELGLQNRVGIRLHTFGKALACNGAAILCSPIMRLYLINYARPLIFTTFMSFPSLVAIRTAYDWMINGRTNNLSQNLQYLIRYLFDRLQSLADSASRLEDPSMLVLPQTCPDSPIFALLSTVPRDLASHCQSLGFVVRPVVPPTVPENTERVRVCLHAGNTTAQIDAFVLCLRDWIKARSKVTAEVIDEPQAMPIVAKL
ncbi:putative 8-amino-7-oxononanoate synthase [Cyphellophora attinorum]|uniref:Putative 8-amino-7-oxononanoate synthase n=1 Tax=Cyphellophora attinorum TaxID=1664694 RepID=A0A0N1P0W3_9EURO|nr:putative 8-amino-7-oxononanoate synthase [Phialophora attinorum]KPI39694.1 putative 8-amino-7-oxononanoate synthase [Phialophora attinorum]